MPRRFQGCKLSSYSVFNARMDEIKTFWRMAYKSPLGSITIGAASIGIMNYRFGTRSDGSRGIIKNEREIEINYSD